MIFLLLALMGIFLYILLVHFRLRVEYTRSGEDDHLRLYIDLKLFSFTYNLPLIKWKGFYTETQTRLSTHKKPLKEKITLEKILEELRISETPLHTFLAALDLFGVLFAGHDSSDDENRSLGSPTIHLFTSPFFFLRHIKVCEKLTWKSRIGSTDPALTGIIVGLVWGLKSTLFSVASTKVKFLNRPTFAVEADFTNPVLETSICCIFRFSLGEIILDILYDLLKEWQKEVFLVGYGRNSSH